jgi:hypothetical protein
MIGDSSGAVESLGGLDEAIAQVAQVPVGADLGLAGDVEFLARVGARRLQEPVAEGISGRLGKDERLIGE